MVTLSLLRHFKGEIMKPLTIRLVKYFFALSILSQLIACSSSSGGGGNGGTPGGGPNPEKDINFEIPVSSQGCMDPFMFVEDWQQKLQDVIQSGEASCVKKAIELGANPKLPVPVDHFDKTKTMPSVHYALQSSPLFLQQQLRDKKALRSLRFL
jgi:hypothetical protein